MIDRGQLIADLDPAIFWEQAYKSVEGYVRQYFAENPTLILTTTDLGEALLPAAEMRGPGNAARARLFKALTALSKHALRHYTVKASEPSTLYGKKYFRTHWKLPAYDSATNCCPHCHRPYESPEQVANAAVDALNI